MLVSKQQFQIGVGGGGKAYIIVNSQHTCTARITVVVQCVYVYVISFLPPRASRP